MSHPEYFLSKPGGPGYDPDEPLLAPWGVIIAARNAVAWLCAEMRNPDRWQDRQDWSWISQHLVAAVENTNPEHEPRIDTREGVIEWLERLRDRLNKCLPGP